MSSLRLDTRSRHSCTAASCCDCSIARCSSRFRRPPSERTLTGVWVVRMVGWPAFSVGTGACHAVVIAERGGKWLDDASAFLIGRFDSLIVFPPEPDRGRCAWCDAHAFSEARDQPIFEDEVLRPRVVLPHGHTHAVKGCA